MVRHDRLPRVTRRNPPIMTVIALVLVTSGATPHPQGNSAQESRVPAETSGRAGLAAAGAPAPNLQLSRAIGPGDWPRLHLPDPVGRYIARKALDLAWERLAVLDCADVLKNFVDRTGQPLDGRLRQLAVDPQTYLTMLVFIDGSRETPCMKGSFAFTTPGSRVVRICVEELKRTWQTSPEHAVSRVIHEMLHTLGLGEDPPSSAEITRRVLAGCGR